MKRKIRILLADDHKMVRQGFRLILLSQDDMEVVGETGNGRDTVELAKTLRPNVVVMDITMPELNGIEATRQIREAIPFTRVLALSVHRDSVYVREGFEPVLKVTCSKSPRTLISWRPSEPLRKATAT